jgi:hypothetical protein
VTLVVLSGGYCCPVYPMEQIPHNCWSGQPTASAAAAAAAGSYLWHPYHRLKHPVQQSPTAAAAAVAAAAMYVVASSATFRQQQRHRHSDLRSLKMWHLKCAAEQHNLGMPAHAGMREGSQAMRC